MPTIDIPDKICPHCGGTKWYQNKGRSWCATSRYNSQKKRYLNRDKEKTNRKRKLTKSYQKNLLKEKKKREEYRKDNPIIRSIPLTIAQRSSRYYAKVKDNADFKKKNIDRARKYYELFPEKVKINSRNNRLLNPEKYNELSKITKRRYRAELNDLYIKDLICFNKDLSFEDIPQEIVEIKRQGLLIYRQLKQLKNEKEN